MNKLVRVICFLFTLLSAPLVFATTSGIQNHDGFYVGMGTGLEITDAEVTLLRPGAIPPGEASQYDVNKPLRFDLQTGVFVGFAHSLDPIRLAVEVGSQYRSTPRYSKNVVDSNLAVIETSTYLSQTHLRTNVIADVLVGTEFDILNGMLVFVRVGYENATFDFEGRPSGAVNLARYSKNLSGLRLGVGAETILLGNIGFRVGYVATLFSDVERKRGVDTLGVDAAPRSHVIRADVTYHFGDLLQRMLNLV